MKKGICHYCGNLRFLTKHLKIGNHQLPFELLSRVGHDIKYGIKQSVGKKFIRQHKKYVPGTKRQHKRK